MTRVEAGMEGGPMIAWVALVGMAMGQGPATVPLRGTVVDQAGEPVAGADLILLGPASRDRPVLARGRSDDAGRFSLDRPIGLQGGDRPAWGPTLWADRPGFRVAIVPFGKTLPTADEPVRVVLGPPGNAKIRVEGPDGQPVPGARVLVYRINPDDVHLPDAFSERSAATTDVDGLATFDAFDPGQPSYADARSAEFGVQGRPIPSSPGQTPTIVLRPVSSARGRLVATDPALVKGWKVRAYTRIPFVQGSAPETTGFVETSTDVEGRFSLPRLAIGGLQLRLEPPEGLDALPEMPPTTAVREGAEVEVAVPVRRAVRVSGVVRERGTGRPIADVGVHSFAPSRNNGGDNTRTDALGRYSFLVLPGKAQAMLTNIPPTHVQAPRQGPWEEFQVADGSGPIELPPRELLPAAPPLRGEVRDEVGRAVAGARVSARWSLKEEKRLVSGSALVTTDESGRFALLGLAPDSTVTLSAKFRDRRNDPETSARAGADQPVMITIAPMPTVAVAGRLIGPGGSPIAGIAVAVRSRSTRPNSPRFDEPAQFDGSAQVRTGADGSYQSPKELEFADREFRVQVSAPGYLEAQTPWASPTPGAESVRFPDLVLKPNRGVRAVSGRVIDRVGAAVPGAEVTQAGDGPRRTSTRTDASGQFRLPGVGGGPAPIFAEAPGFRFGGAIVAADGRDFVVRLDRVGDPSAPLDPQPPPLNRAEERALAADWLAPILDEPTNGPILFEGGSPYSILARLDPPRGLALLEDRAVGGGHNLLEAVAIGQFEDDPDAALATIRADLDPASRAAEWLAIERSRADLARPRREDLLGRALLDARSVVALEPRALLLGRLADRWLDLGAVDRASPLIREAQGLFAKLPPQSRSFEVEAFGEILAAVDLPAALELFERKGVTSMGPVDELTRNRRLSGAAVRLASTDPAAAARLLPGPSGPFSERPGFVIRIVRRMARVDLARAREVLNSVDAPIGGRPSGRPELAPFGLGLIAEVVADSDPVAARALLDEAFAGLRRLALERPELAGRRAIAALMGRLLPVVARVDPARVAERCWLAAASRPPSADRSTPSETSTDVERALVLAMELAPFNRPLADAVSSGAADRLGDLLAESPPTYYGSASITALRALAAYDPRLVAPLLRSLPEAARRPPARPSGRGVSAEARLRIAAATVLATPSQDRAREATRLGNYPWPLRPDE